MGFERVVFIVASLGVFIFVAACSEKTSPGDVQASVADTRSAASTTAPHTASSPATTQPFAPVADQTNLHNAHVVTSKVVSGAQPEGEASFKLLQELGVKTIISVDGAAPDVEGAKKFGMRYVHLPIGYDGVDPTEGKAIAKAIQELPGKVYVHCHHGKHRSAAAVAVACVYNGELKPEQAELVLQIFGTGANYAGLWKAAREARPLGDAELSALKIDYVEVAKIDDFAETMVHVDQHWEHVKAIKKAGWKAPADHPDLDPPHEVLMVQERLHEGGRLEPAGKRPAEFHALLGEGETALKALAEMVGKQPIDTTAADTAFNDVVQNCTACHKDHRD